MLNISFYAVDFSTEKLQNVLQRQRATAFPEVPVSFRWPAGEGKLFQHFGILSLLCEEITRKGAQIVILLE